MHEKVDLPTTLSRRNLLALAGGAAVLTVLGGDAQTAGGYPLPTEDVQVPLKSFAANTPSRHPFESIDVPYLRTLLHELERRRTDRAAKITAVRQSRRVVEIHTAEAAIYGRGTAFEIDQSGIYVTAGHLLNWLGVATGYTNYRGNTMAVVNPYTAKANEAQAFILHPDADMGIIYAPTGRQRRPTPNMQISTGSIKHGTPLWMIGLFPGTQLSEVQKFGTVIGHTSTLTVVKDMRPFGGTSGSPVIDMQGTIVGLEKGYYPGTATQYEEYKGATITPMRFLATIEVEGYVAYQA